MVDLGQITALVAGINGSIEILKAAKGVSDSAETNAAVINIQDDLLVLQAKAFAMHEIHSHTLQENAELKEAARKAEDWARQAENYVLHDFGRHTYAYVTKAGVDTDEPEHYLCARCYQNSEKSILQFHNYNKLCQNEYRCPACETIFPLEEG